MKHKPKQINALHREIGGNIRISERGVPHLVFTHNGITMSACWFNRNQHYRIFTPYNALIQQRHDFETVAQIVEWMQSK